MLLVILNNCAKLQPMSISALEPNEKVEMPKNRKAEIGPETQQKASRPILNHYKMIRRC
jgi:hypothetical protein